MDLECQRLLRQGWLNARLAYNFRSDWLTVVADSNNGNLPIYRKGEGYLDAKVTFRFPNGIISCSWRCRTSTRIFKTYIKNIGTSEVYYPASASSQAST
jgi:hypothetical protein